MPKEHRTGTGRRQEVGLDWRKLEFKKRNLCKKRGINYKTDLKQSTKKDDSSKEEM